MMGDLVGAAGGGATGDATGGKTGIGTASCAEGLLASAPVEILRGKRLSGSSAMGAIEATNWDATGCGLDAAGAGCGATGGEFGAKVSGFGEGDGGVGGTEAADRMAP